MAMHNALSFPALHLQHVLGMVAPGLKDHHRRQMWERHCNRQDWNRLGHGANTNFVNAHAQSSTNNGRGVWRLARLLGLRTDTVSLTSSLAALRQGLHYNKHQSEAQTL